MELSIIITEIKTWLTSTYKSTVSSGTARVWCMLGLSKSPSMVNINTYFDRQALNDKFKDQYANNDLKTKEAYAYTQAEVNLIASAHRGFANRHKTRLQIYRDDCQQKQYNTQSTITLGYVKHTVSKEYAEEKR